jgi:hypothetical protein
MSLNIVMVNRAYNVSMSVVCTPNNRNCISITLKFIFLAWYRRYLFD